ncbi:UNVERIFIED_CONTAM: hypothetical protein Sindi_0081200 [Sesamum indicum]
MNSPGKMVAGPSKNDVAPVSEVAHTFCDVEDDVDKFSADEMAEDEMAQVMVGIPDDISNTMADVSSARAEVSRSRAEVSNDAAADVSNDAAADVSNDVNGEVIVRPTLDAIHNGAKHWKATAVGYFLGKRLYFHHLKEYAVSVWSGLREVTGTTNGFFFFQFKSIAAMEDIIEGGPWLFQGQPIVLQKWEPGMVETATYAEEGLSTVVSGVGKPLYPDAITRACTRLDFARVCVMLDITSNLPKHIIIMIPHEDGGESPYKVDVEYEWLPPKCTICMTLGHSAKECALNKTKPAKPPIAIYVPKVGAPCPAVHERSRNHPTYHMREEQTVTRDTTSIPPRLPPTLDREMRRPSPTRVVEKQREGQESPRADTRPNREERGKALVIYNTFDALHLLDDTDELSRAIWNVRGLNKRDHQLAVKDIVAEFRLHFLGLLETRVRINNVAQIQSFLLPHWKWFVDYGSSGTRVWIAWDANFIDVVVIESGTQFMHCLINIHALHESVAITVIYGATEMADRRELWRSLETISLHCVDVPWLVGGDFNAVRDISEICGASGDIRMAMDEFNICIQNVGLLPLPMQGEWYTWHNCSVSPRNPWKRLDRMLINDRWMARFPNSFYSSLTPRTSDNSPLVLYGDRQQQLGGMSRFDNYLTLSPDFIPGVQRVWQHNIIGVPMYVVTRKLKALKAVFREQRRKKGDLTHNVQLEKGFLEMAQTLVSSNRRDELFLQLEHCCRIVLAKAVKLEQLRIKRRDRMVTPRIFSKLHGQYGLGGYFGSVGFLYHWPNSKRDQYHIVGAHTKAFVPGRSIGDNIMLAQELFTRYNQARLPPRCALKVDIRKAYDTMEWDFLLAVLELFGFPTTFKSWIEACVTTPSFSVGLNGKPHGFFMGLDRFAEWSGLRLNIQKSHLIISRSAQGLREEMLAVLGFQEGLLPMRYLGIPLLSSRLSIADCRPLLLKMDKRISGWEGLALSYAGRVQIIKSVLMLVSLYWTSAFILPKKVTYEIEKRMRNFLWKGTTNSGYAKVAWKELCRPVEEGGLGFKDITTLNRALMTKKLCDIIRCDRTSIWVEWLYQGQLRDTSIWTIQELGETFPQGPRLLGLDKSAKLSTVISGGEWQWPMKKKKITDFECLEITHTLPAIRGGDDRVVWRFDQGQPTTQALYRLFDPPRPKVGWSSLLSGSLFFFGKSKFH